MLPGSRLYHYDLIEVDGVQFYEERPVKLDKPVKFYRIKAGDRIDLIANSEYGAPSWWWIIAQHNKLFEIPSDFKVGELIELLGMRSVIRL